MSASHSLSRRTTLLIYNVLCLITLAACQGVPPMPEAQVARSGTAATSLNVVVETATPLAQATVKTLIAAVESVTQPQNVRVRAKGSPEGVKHVDFELINTRVASHALKSAILGVGPELAAATITVTTIDGLEPGDLDPEVHEALQHDDAATAKAQAEQVLRQRGQGGEVSIEEIDGARRVQIKVERVEVEK